MTTKEDLTLPSDRTHTREEAIAAVLLEIEAVALRPADPFTWASGLRSPIYCDNRLIMGYPQVRDMTTAAFAECLKEQGFAPDVIAGTATAGIPHAAWLAHETALPMIYVRSKPKEHGRGNQIEGPVKPGQSAVVIEDLISTGKSSVAVAEALKREHIRVMAVLSIFSYGFTAAEHEFEQAGVPFYSLSNYEALIRVAARKGRLSEKDLEALRAWRDDPYAWSDMFADDR